jgi:hypothetical protein
MNWQPRLSPLRTASGLLPTVQAATSVDVFDLGRCGSGR